MAVFLLWDYLKFNISYSVAEDLQPCVLVLHQHWATDVFSWIKLSLKLKRKKKKGKGNVNQCDNECCWIVCSREQCYLS